MFFGYKIALGLGKPKDNIIDIEYLLIPKPLIVILELNLAFLNNTPVAINAIEQILML